MQADGPIPKTTTRRAVLISVTANANRGALNGNSWFWGLHGVQNGPGPINGFVRTLDDAKAKFAAAWGAWLKAAGLNEDTPTAQLKNSGIGMTIRRHHAGWRAQWQRRQPLQKKS
jgi:hypothetical protein